MAEDGVGEIQKETVPGPNNLIPCIYKVPDWLKDHACDSNDRTPYEPEFVSIGPYHRGNPRVEEMEKHKWRCLDIMLKRNNQNLDEYLTEMKKIQKAVRTCYQGPYKEINDEDFVQMLVLDGCFMLEFLRGSKLEFNNLNYESDDPVFSKVALMLVIARDMIKLENQIPLIVLEKLLALQYKLPIKNKKHIPKLVLRALNLLSITNHALTEAQLKTTWNAVASNPDNMMLHCLDIFRSGLLYTPDPESPQKGEPIGQHDGANSNLTQPDLEMVLLPPAIASTSSPSETRANSNLTQPDLEMGLLPPIIASTSSPSDTRANSNLTQPDLEMVLLPPAIASTSSPSDTRANSNLTQPDLEMVLLPPAIASTSSPSETRANSNLTQPDLEMGLLPPIIASTSSPSDTRANSNLTQPDLEVVLLPPAIAATSSPSEKRANSNLTQPDLEMVLLPPIIASTSSPSDTRANSNLTQPDLEMVLLPPAISSTSSLSDTRANSNLTQPDLEMVLLPPAISSTSSPSDTRANSNLTQPDLEMVLLPPAIASTSSPSDTRANSNLTQPDLEMGLFPPIIASTSSPSDTRDNPNLTRARVAGTSVLGLESEDDPMVGRPPPVHADSNSPTIASTSSPSSTRLCPPDNSSSDEDESPNSGQQIRANSTLMIYCVHDLVDAGVTFKTLGCQQFWDLRFDMSHGLLTIPPIKIDDATKTLFLNLIAYEQCHLRQFWEMSITDYVAFMDNLVNSESDVSHLYKAGIIVHQLGSDVEVADLFNRLVKKAVVEWERGNLSTLYKDLNEYCSHRRHGWRASWQNDYLKNPWVIISILAAIVLFGATLTQTYFSVLAYKKPPKS